ncbi:hypothetical protein Pcinc_040609 [Petrolisthes cinctipes]|uniref:Secreted protein n=1 Tax=Petrolisthes cinctipes TaxID=88211 RepID=A0AAE1BL54_PETCI|nr:hypothetical protein Pcinc_040609 [Petrolisthes cinctipes]
MMGAWVVFLPFLPNTVTSAASLLNLPVPPPTTCLPEFCGWFGWVSGCGRVTGRVVSLPLPPSSVANPAPRSLHQSTERGALLAPPLPAASAKYKSPSSRYHPGHAPHTLTSSAIGPITFTSSNQCGCLR